LSRNFDWFRGAVNDGSVWQSSANVCYWLRLLKKSFALCGST